MGILIYGITIINKQNKILDSEFLNLIIMSLLVIFVAIMYYRTRTKPIIFIDEPEPILEEPIKNRRKSVEQILKENMPKTVTFKKTKPKNKKEKNVVKEPEIEISEKDND